ncbi:MAG TPA: ATP-binding protein [Candidatus Sumerlaeota bacterium]|nr:ATP-binding protein [Candidatus Sumerlaeota bacterium]
MKIRERIIVAFGGLLVLLLLLAGVSLSLTSDFSNSLGQATQDNSHIVVNATSIFVQLPKVGSAALFSTEEDRQSATAHVRDVERVNSMINEFAHSVRLDEKSEEIVELKRNWAEYSESVRLAYMMPAGPAKNAYWEGTIQPAAMRTRESLEKVIRTNMELSDRTIEELQVKLDRAQLMLMVIAGLGLLLSIGFMLALGRLFVQPTRELVMAIDSYDTEPPERALGSRRRSDEIGDLADALDRLLHRVRETRRDDARLMKRIERRSEMAMDCLPDAVFVLDRDGRIGYMNAIARKMVEAAPATAPEGIPWPTIRLMVEQAAHTGNPEIRRELDKSLQIFINGDEKFFLPGVFPLLNEQGSETDELVLLLSDVSYLRQLDEMKTDLVATVSHQLKTPLTAVRMSLHMLRSNNEDLAQIDKELLSTAIDESERLHETIENLLGMARIQAGAMKMQVETVDTSKWIHDVVDGFHGVLREKGITLTQDVPADLPPLRIDVPRMGVVFENLMSNCAKYCRAGDKVHVRAKKDRSDPLTVIIAVSDTGPGISRTDITRIFDKFFRGGTREKPGVGLGLAIARRIINAHGGEMTCYSVEGEGTTFTIVLHCRVESALAGSILSIPSGNSIAT